MIFFGIPLRSKAASNDWGKVEKIFNRTLRSIYRQTCPDFRIIVACHDIPVLEQTCDDRVEFLVSDAPLPTSRREMMLDKGWKLSMIAKRVRELGSGYVMMVDSDDLISDRIAQFCAEHPDENGFLSGNGYVYNEGLAYAKKIHKIYGICGSCAIVNYRPEDLPEELPVGISDEEVQRRFVFRRSHRQIPEDLAAAGRPLAPLPFPGVVYVRNTGDNHSMLGGNDLSWKRKLELAVSPRIPIEGKLKDEFGF